MSRTLKSPEAYAQSQKHAQLNPASTTASQASPKNNFL